MMEYEKTESNDQVEVPITERGIATTTTTIPISNKSSWKGVVGDHYRNGRGWLLLHHQKKQQQKHKHVPTDIVVVSPSTPTKNNSHHHYGIHHPLEIPSGCLSSPSTSDDSFMIGKNDTLPTITTTTSLSQDIVLMGGGGGGGGGGTVDHSYEKKNERQGKQKYNLVMIAVVIGITVLIASIITSLLTSLLFTKKTSDTNNNNIINVNTNNNTISNSTNDGINITYSWNNENNNTDYNTNTTISDDTPMVLPVITTIHNITFDPNMMMYPINCSYRINPLPLLRPLHGKKGIGLAMKMNTNNTTNSLEKNKQDVANTIKMKMNEYIQKIQQLNTYWHYNWSFRRVIENNGMITSNIFNVSTTTTTTTTTTTSNTISTTTTQPSQFVPMAWSGGVTNTQFLQRVIDHEIIELVTNGTIDRIFGFNEPDASVQANMTVEIAIERFELFQNVLSTLNPNIAYITPSCVKADREWMQQFIVKAYEKCIRMDSIGIHWYGPPNGTTFRNTITRYYELYGKTLPITITEFAVADWDATTIQNNRYTKNQVLQFQKDVLPWLEQTNFIIGYSWFSFQQGDAVGTSSALFYDNNTTQLTKLGQYYASVTSTNIYGNTTIQF